MNNSNKIKNEFLGMPYGTANNRLKKKILFSLLIELNKNKCFQCGKKIENIDELSIEHKKPWLHNDVKLFWDINNISFSHLRCNSSNKRTPNKRKNIDGKRWCWRCKKYKDIKSFPPSAKIKRNRECTECGNKYRRHLRRRYKQV